MDKIYDSQFFQSVTESSLDSARVIVSLVLELLQPNSVLDVGCGRGAWLKAFSQCGVDAICGIDGDYVVRDALLIPRDAFIASDLRKPLPISGRYDLAVCLEVVEHLSEREGVALVQAVTRLSDVVMFSAAVPGQGGAGHVNERWPEFWGALFDREGFELVDCVRPQIATRRDVAWWFRQNIVLYARQAAFERWPALKAARDRSADGEWCWIHRTIGQQLTVRTIMKQLPRALLRAVRSRLPMLLGGGDRA